MGTATGTELAARTLWPHFAALSDPATTIVRGEGCYVEDDRGRRYLDALSGLYCVQIGYSFGEELGAAAAAQMGELPYFPIWGFAHPPAQRLADAIAERAPGELNRVFFGSGGADAVESAWKLARQFHASRGERRWKVVARRDAWHGTSLGALSINGLAASRTPFEPLVPDVVRIRNTASFRRPDAESEEELTAFLLDEVRSAIEGAGPDTIAMVIAEPVQNAGGSLTPPRGYWPGLRALCDEFGVLLCADEVITGFGRLGEWFASPLFEIEPDMITCAKGLSSGYVPIGALVASERVVEPFLADDAVFNHGLTFGGHPVTAAVALKNIEVMEREGVLANVREQAPALRAALEPLLELPIVGELRGAGFFLALELVADPATKRSFADAEAEHILGDVISEQLFERGLLCRTDDRVGSVISIAPPLIAGEAEFSRIAATLRDVLADAWTAHTA